MSPLPPRIIYIVMGFVAPIQYKSIYWGYFYHFVQMKTPCLSSKPLASNIKDNRQHSETCTHSLLLPKKLKQSVLTRRSSEPVIRTKDRSEFDTEQRGRFTIVRQRSSHFQPPLKRQESRFKPCRPPILPPSPTFRSPKTPRSPSPLAKEIISIFKDVAISQEPRKRNDSACSELNVITIT